MRFNLKKVLGIITWFALKEGGEIDKVKLLKLVYLADRLHLRDYGRRIIPGKYYGMRMGPVHSEVKDIVDSNIYDDSEKQLVDESFTKVNHDIRLLKDKHFEKALFSKSEIDALEKTWNNFGCFSNWDLKDITHLYPELKKKENELNEDCTRFSIDLEECFDNLSQAELKELKEKYGFNEDPFAQTPEVLEYSKEQYLYEKMLDIL
jgi:uncharacterized phage-associated protein